MKRSAYKLQFSRNPLVQIAAIVVAALITVGAVLLGAVILSFFIGLAILASIIFSIRLWWLRRRVRRGDTSHGEQVGEIVGVEYTVVEERSVQNTHHRDSE